MNKFVLKLSVFFCLILSTIVHAQKGTLASQGMVVSARVEASKLGVEILKQGGNAFDAMVTVELALAVVYPYAGNLGGGGFMVYRLKNGESGSLDYREKAPMAARVDMYLDCSEEVIPGLSTQTALGIAVPGTVAGILEAHRKMGSLPLDSLIMPVIRLAEKGVLVTEKQAERLKKYRPAFVQMNGEETFFNQDFKVGDTIQYQALAQTLRLILQKGKDGFYQGKVADEMVSLVQSKGGIMTLEDLALYEPVWRDPVKFNYKDLQIISMAPPSSGGITLAQIMGMIEPFPLKKMGFNSTKYIQVLVEAERRAYSDRNFHLGDPDFVSIPQNHLLSKTYLKQRMQNFSFKKATPTSVVKRGNFDIQESTETTHYSIVDSFGNAVSVTTTLNDAYGSKLFSESLGFFFNNEMDDFSAKPGVPNVFGLIGAEANAIAPQKRMLSSMTPTIVEKEGELWMVLGSPGGSTIITSVLQTILNVYEFQMNMQEAVTVPRFHHQGLPDEVILEPNSFSAKVIYNLKQKGYHLNQTKTRVIGKVDAILVKENGILEGGADPRGDDAAVGFLNLRFK